MSKATLKLALDLATMHHTDESYDELRSKVRVVAKEELAKQEQGGWHTHDLYTDSDKDRPDVICDSNGQVTLGLCKRCGRGEAELETPCDKPKQEQGEPEMVRNMRMWVTALKSVSDNGQHMKIPSGLSSGTCWELAVALEKFIDTTPQLKQEQGEPVAIIHRNEYNEYRLEPHDSFDIKSIPFNVELVVVHIARFLTAP